MDCKNNILDLYVTSPIFSWVAPVSNHIVYHIEEEAREIEYEVVKLASFSSIIKLKYVLYMQLDRVWAQY